MVLHALDLERSSQVTVRVLGPLEVQTAILTTEPFPPPRELKSPEVVRCLTWQLRSEPRSSGRGCWEF